jgi:hypothetical protein
MPGSPYVSARTGHENTREQGDKTLVFGTLEALLKVLRDVERQRAVGVGVGLCLVEVAATRGLFG